MTFPKVSECCKAVKAAASLMEMEAHNLPVGVIASSVDMGQAVIDDAH